MGNLSNLDIVQSDLPFGAVDCVYSDPPWGESNLKFWRTHNQQTGHPVDWPAFLDRFFAICNRHRPGGPWFVETGVRFVSDCERASPIGLTERYECRYRAGSKWLPNVLLVFGGHAPKPPIPEADRHGQKLIRWAISGLPSGSAVLDPCCGLGGTAKACKKLGLAFFGNELNPKRLDRTRKIVDSMVSVSR